MYKKKNVLKDLMKKYQGPSMPSLAPFGQAVSEEKIFLTLANQKKELILATMFVGQMERNGETLQRTLKNLILIDQYKYN
jgi:hypothetical protein